VPLVQDFVPVAERFDQAGLALVSGRGSWLEELVTAAVAPVELTSVEFGDARSVAQAVIVPLRWVANEHDGPFTALEADLRLEPVPPRGSHLGFSGTYETPSAGDTRDAVTRRHQTEACIRRFIAAVATTLERGGAEVHAMTTPRS
jgi:hypothetical protein